MLTLSRVWIPWTLAAGLVPLAAGQTPAPLSPQTAPSVQPAAPGAPQALMLRPTYVLGAGDQILIRAFQVEEISDKPFRITSEGTVDLPLLGRIPASGLTVEAFEAGLMERLKTYVRNPQVTVTVVQYRSEPVFVVGAFRSPGVYPLLGRRTLLDLLTAVGGLQPNSSRRIKVTRRVEFGRLPLPNAEVDPEGKHSSAEISLGSLQQSINPAEDIVLQPFDVISAERAELVYISGEVIRAGSYELGDRSYITVTQALVMAGGLGRDAAVERAKVLRPVLDTSRRAEIALNVKEILNGRANDFPLMPNDVLFVPRAPRRSRAIMTGVLVGAPLISTVLWIVLRR